MGADCGDAQGGDARSPRDGGTARHLCFRPLRVVQLGEDPDITILASLDSSTFPVGTNSDETWYDGYYPVVWTNNNYRMIYFNMGHNLVQYGQPYRDLSHTFDCEEMAAMVLEGLFGLAE